MASFTFDMWDGGFQVGTFSDRAKTNGYLINFYESNSVKFYKIVNGTTTNVWTR